MFRPLTGCYSKFHTHFAHPAACITLIKKWSICNLCFLWNGWRFRVATKFSLTLRYGSNFYVVIYMHIDVVTKLGCRLLCVYLQPFLWQIKRNGSTFLFKKCDLRGCTLFFWEGGCPPFFLCGFPTTKSLLPLNGAFICASSCCFPVLHQPFGSYFLSQCL